MAPDPPKRDTPAASDAKPPHATAAPDASRPPADRFTVGRLIDHGRARHEFQPQGTPSYYVKILTDSGERTIWGGKSLEVALQKSRSQPQLNDRVGVRENNLAPVSFVMRERNAQGVVVATRQQDTPRPHWVVEKLEEFDLRAAAARALRDATLSRREAVLNHRELRSAFWILDAAQQYAADRWPNPRTREVFLTAVRETLARTLERGIDLPVRTPDDSKRALAGPPTPTAPASRTRE